jgi:hypothetical protein
VEGTSRSKKRAPVGFLGDIEAPTATEDFQHARVNDEVGKVEGAEDDEQRRRLRVAGAFINKAVEWSNRLTVEPPTLLQS